MSDAEDRDLLAAEHVMGVLENADAARARTLLAEDPAFAEFGGSMGTAADPACDPGGSGAPAGRSLAPH